MELKSIYNYPALLDTQENLIDLYGDETIFEIRSTQVSSSGETIILQWCDDNYNALKYAIYRSRNGAEFVLRAELDGYHQAFVDDQVVRGNTYQYKVEVVNTSLETASGDFGTSAVYSLVKNTVDPELPEYDEDFYSRRTVRDSLAYIYKIEGTRIRKYDPTGTTLEAESPDYGGALEAVIVSREGATNYIYTGGYTTGKVWKLSSSTLAVLEESAAFADVRSLTRGEDGIFAGTGSFIRKLDYDLSQITISADQSANINCLFFGKDKKLYAGTGTIARRFNPSTLAVENSSTSYGDELRSVILGYNYKIYAAGDSVKKVRILDYDDLSTVVESQLLSDNIEYLTYGLDKVLYAANSAVDTVWRMDPNNLGYPHEMPEPGQSGIFDLLSAGPLCDVQFYDQKIVKDNKGNIFYINEQKVVKADAETLVTIAESSDYGGAINEIAYSTNNGGWLYIAGNVTGKVWKIDPATMMTSVESDVFDDIEALIHHGRKVYVGSAGRVVSLWDHTLSTAAMSEDYGGTVRDIHYGWYDKLYVAIDDMLFRLDIDTLKEEYAMYGYGGNIWSVIHGYNGDIYIGGDTVNKVWRLDPNTFAKKEESLAYGGTIQSIRFGLDRYLYVSGLGGDGSWQLDPDTLAFIKETGETGDALANHWDIYSELYVAQERLRRYEVTDYQSFVPIHLYAPENIVAERMENDIDVKINWDDPGNDFHYGYLIHVSEAGGDYEFLTAVPYNQTSFIHYAKTIPSYQYKVEAFLGPLESAVTESNEVESGSEPDTPQNVAAARHLTDNTKNVVTWDDVETENSYVIYASTSGGAYNEIDTVPADTEEYEHSGINRFFDYQYQVVARNIAGDSDPGTSNLLAADVGDAPTNAVATKSGLDINVSWMAGTGLGHWIYRQSYNDVAEEWNTIEFLTSVGIATTSHDDQTVAPGILYRYEIRTYTDSGPSDPAVSNEESSTSSVVLNWTPSTSNDVVYQKLDRTKDGISYAHLADLARDTNQYLDDTIERTVKYDYLLYAVDDAGNFSEPATVTQRV